MYVSQVMLIAMLMLLILRSMGWMVSLLRSKYDEARGWNSIRNGFFLT